MNYRFADAVYQFFNQPEPVWATQFGQLLTSIHRDYGYEPSLMLQNLLGSHDTARIGSAVVNPTHRQDHQSSPQDNRQYAVRQPTAEEKRRWKQLVAFQFLFPGAPYIYYGDEVGMWGGDDPDCRKPMLWPDLKFADERAHPFGLERPVNAVSPDREVLAFYRRMAQWRNDHEVLRTGRFQFTLMDDERRLVAFHRRSVKTGETILAIFNASDDPRVIRAGDVTLDSFVGWTDLWTNSTPSTTSLQLSPRWFVVLRRE
jgi:cyclomaltodextrinase